MHATKWAFLAIFCGIFCGIGCGGGDDGAQPSQVCSDAQAKAKSCGFAATGTCDSKSPALILCVAACTAKAECADLSAQDKKNPFTLCGAACQGAGPDDFVCDDVTGYVSKPGVCNGRFDCQDGSDEAHCADGGAP